MIRFLLIRCFILFTVSATAQTDTVPENDTTLFIAAEEPAQFPGGDAALMNYLIKNLKLPQPAGACPTQAIFMKFVIEKDGSVSNVQPAKACDCNSGLCQQITDVLKNMPRWQPAKTKGNPVRTQFHLPVRIHPR